MYLNFNDKPALKFCPVFSLQKSLFVTASDLSIINKSCSFVSKTYKYKPVSYGFEGSQSSIIFPKFVSCLNFEILVVCII